MLDGIDLVILDFDGVVADSEVISLRTLQSSLADFGIDLSADDVRSAFLGTSLATIAGYVAEHGPARTATGFAEAWQTALFARFRAELRPIPHLLALLEHLADRGIRHCIASSGTFERIGVALSAIRLTERFEKIFSAEQVDRGKPAPDLFLMAAHQLGVPPAKCAVVEDSPYGVRAARAADMRSIGFVGGTHLKHIQAEHADLLRRNGADCVVASLHEIAGP